MIHRDAVTDAMLDMRDRQQSALLRAELARCLTQDKQHPLLQIFPSPEGTLTILSVTTDGRWVETRLARLEDVTSEYLDDMERRAKARSPVGLRIV